MADTRSKTQIWLLGHEEFEITGSKLPSYRQVLKVFFHYHKTLKKTIHESSRLVIKQVLQFWKKARIPTRLEKHAIQKLESLYDKWIKLKKNASRQTDTQKKKENEFIENLENLFDIAHMDALMIMKIKEDRDFLLAQREKGRKGCMGQVDMVLAAKETRAIKRKIISEDKKIRSQLQEKALSKCVHLEKLSSSETEDEGEIYDAKLMKRQDKFEKSAHINKRGTISIFTPMFSGYFRSN